MKKILFTFTPRNTLSIAAVVTGDAITNVSASDAGRNSKEE